MKFNRKVYWGETARKNRLLIWHRLRYKKWQTDIYLIVLPEGKNSLLEMVPAYMMKLRPKGAPPLMVIGVAKGKKEGIEVIRSIIDEVYKQTGHLDVLSYIRG